jgi:TerC family integral membrane protein
MLQGGGIMQVLALWGFFAGLAIGMLLIDILRFMVKPQDLSLREASWWTAAWTALAALFSVAVFTLGGQAKGMEFVTGYAITWALSVGNVFVFFMIFQYFAVPPASRPRALFLGILGAMVLRCLFISHAAEMLASFSWLIYVFWIFLVWVGIKLLLHRGVDAGLRRNLRFCTHIVTVEPSYDGENFFVRREDQWVATALLPVIVLALAADVMFAVDAIAATHLISGDPFVVYSSNLLAILGLRALYSLLSGILGMFRYLQAGLCLILLYIGSRMMISEFVEVPIGVSLGVVVAVLSSSIAASILFRPTSGKALSGIRRLYQWAAGNAAGREGGKHGAAGAGPSWRADK